MTIYDAHYFSNKSSEEREKLRLLRMTRAGYAQERILHNFLLDAYIGGGGFQNGLIPSPDAPFWGRRAYERGRSLWLDTQQQLIAPRQPEHQAGPSYQCATSYLVAFHGEDMDSFQDRIKTSSYLNPCEKIVRFTNALLMQQDAQRTNIPPELATWSQDVDQHGRSLNQTGRNQVLRGQIFGWGGTLTDTPKGGSTSLADSLRLKLQPYCVLICPQEILDWDCSPDRKLTAIKLSFLFEHPRENMLSMKMWEEHILIWYRDRWERYVILLPPAELCTDPHDPELGRLYSQESGPNPSGEIPMSFFAWDEGLGGLSSYGLPQIFNIAKAAWDMFQISSELRRLMRDTTFPTLVREQSASVKGNLKMGTGNYVTETKDFLGGTRFISPPSTSAQVYEARLDAIGENLHRMSGVDSGSKKLNETAESMRIRFQQTEAMLMNASSNTESWELDVLRRAGRLFGIRDSALARMQVMRPKSFDVGRYAAQIDEAIKVLKLPWGPESLKQIMRRTLRSAIPNGNPVDMAALDAEISKTVDENYDRFLEQVLPTAKTPTPSDGTAGTPTQPPPPSTQES